MSRKYEPEFKHKIVRLHLEEGRTYQSITAEYGVSKTAVSDWCEEFSNECRSISQNNPTAFNEADLMKENNRLRREPEEAEKEVFFLKKRGHSLRRRSVKGLPIYR
ncbi:MAG: transposase [Johnsonella sp.]|nr:transposase [Johnsonella sp.]